MKTSDDTSVSPSNLAIDEIITESGRVFRPGNKELLENIPPDIVQEMAKRKWEEIKRSKDT